MAEYKIIIDGNNGKIILHDRYFASVDVEGDAKIHEVVDACAHLLKRRNGEANEFITEQKRLEEEICDCYQYEYSKSGGRRWCVKCGKEDIGF